MSFEWKNAGFQEKAMQAQFRGRKTVERVRGRWQDAVRVDAERLLGVRNWKTSARNREVWGGQGPNWAV
jgi:hypothetical protein